MNVQKGDRAVITGSSPNTGIIVEVGSYLGAGNLYYKGELVVSRPGMHCWEVTSLGREIVYNKGNYGNAVYHARTGPWLDHFLRKLTPLPDEELSKEKEKELL